MGQPPDRAPGSWKAGVQRVVQGLRATAAKWSPFSPRIPTMRQKVQAHLTLSQTARKSSGFRDFAAKERLGFSAAAPAAPSSVKKIKTVLGPAAVPNNFVIYSDSTQPSVYFDKRDPRLKRVLLQKAARLRANTALGSWEKITRIQKVIRQKVPHAGNETSVGKNPNPYTRFNAKRMEGDGLARLGEYLRVGKAVCREQAYLTHIALQTVGFEVRAAPTGWPARLLR